MPKNKDKAMPPMSDEARNARLISLAYDRAEEQLMNGTASSQVISHFLKLGSPREKAETIKAEKECRLVDAKIENIESSQRSEELYENALNAMRKYSGDL